ncbi:MAG: replicative DNA helicase, partial [Bacteroidota bacterium]|nr:replicative DNA helicase [Bacteroidota bacterium]
ADHLKQRRKLDKVGGKPYLSLLINNVHTDNNLGTYAKIIRNKSLFKQLITISTEIIEQSYEKETDALVSKAEQLINEVARNCEQSEITHIAKIVKKSFSAIDSAYSNDSVITGVTTGFWELDDITNGLQRSDLIIIGGRPGMGKSSLALNIAKNCAELPSCNKVAFFSLETSKIQLVLRLLSSIAEVETRYLNKGTIEDVAWPRLSEAATIISELPIYMDDTPGISVDEMRAKARRLQKNKGLDMVIIDYLQLMSGDCESREREIAKILRSLKEMAKELNVPVIALSQLNRNVESRSDKRPQLSDLRESEAFEEDADVIMFIYRDEYYNKDNPYNKDTAEILVCKQRNGPTGVINLRFFSQFSCFLDLYK